MMKKFLLVLTIGLIGIGAQAQDVETIKNMLILNQFKKAKEDIDKGMANAKFSAKPESQLLKAAVYAGLAMDPASKNTPAGDAYTAEADAAFQKYKSLDASMKLLNEDATYQQSVINLYYAYYFSGYNDYDKDKWSEGFVKLKKAVEYSDLLINKKIMKDMVLDTNVLILAGVTAEKSQNLDEAVRFYTRLADAKLAGKDYESIYRYLMVYYFNKKDMPNFEKYKAVGMQLYPNSEYFKYDKVDFAIGLMDKWEDKLKAIEEVLATDPNNKKANDLYWGVIYDVLNPENEADPLPPNAAELEQKMIGSINKAITMDPANEAPLIYLGNHMVLKKEKIAERRQKHADEMKARTKPGTMASKEDVAKRDALDKEYFDAMDAIRGPYEKAAAIFATKSNLDAKQKQQYRNIAGYLAEIYELKKNRAKAGSPEQKTFAAEETKWNALYDSIKTK